MVSLDGEGGRKVSAPEASPLRLPPPAPRLRSVAGSVRCLEDLQLKPAFTARTPSPCEVMVRTVILPNRSFPESHGYPLSKKVIRCADSPRSAPWRRPNQRQGRVRHVNPSDVEPSLAHIATRSPTLRACGLEPGPVWDSSLVVASIGPLPMNPDTPSVCPQGKMIIPVAAEKKAERRLPPPVRCAIQQEAHRPGAQTERWDKPGPVRLPLGGEGSPGEFFRGLRTDNASLTFFRQRIAYLLSLRTDSASLSSVVEKDAVCGTSALVLPRSPGRLRRRADAGGPTESPANCQEKVAPRGTTTGAVEHTWATLPVC